MKKEELLRYLDEMWQSATIGNTWRLRTDMKQAYKEIVALINRGKPKVSEEFIEEKANIIADMITDYSLGGHRQKKPIEMDELQYFIRSLVDSLRGEK